MRKFSTMTKIIMGVPLVFLLLVVGFVLFKSVSVQSAPLVLPSGTIVYDQYDNQVKIETETTVKKYWNGLETINVGGVETTLGESSLAFTDNNQSAILLDKGIAIMPDGTFISIPAGSVIEYTGSSFTTTNVNSLGETEDVTLVAGTTIKAGDRTYAVLGDTVIDELTTSETFTSIFLGEAGNPVLMNSIEVFRYSGNKELLLADGSTFDLSNEKITKVDGVEIDLKSIGGSTNQFKESTASTGTGENGTDAAADQAAAEQAAQDAANNNNNANQAQEPGRVIVLDPERYNQLLKKDAPSGFITNVSDITSKSATVTVSYTDSSNTLISPPTVVVRDKATGATVFSGSATVSTVNVTGLEPAKTYVVDLIISYDTGDGVKEESLDDIEFTTPAISAVFSIKTLRQTSADLNIVMNDGVKLDGANLQVYEYDTGLAVGTPIPLNVSLLASASGQSLTISGLLPATKYEVKITNASYVGAPVTVLGSATFTTVGVSSYSASFEEVDDGNIVLEIEQTNNAPVLYKYSAIDVVDGSVDGYLETEEPSVNFDYNSGLVSGTQYYIKAEVVENNEVVETIISPSYTYEIPIKITNITQSSDEATISYSGLLFSKDPLDVVILQQMSDGSLNEVARSAKSSFMDTKIVVPGNLDNGSYVVQFQKSGSNEVVASSPSYDYVRELKNNEKIYNDLLYVNNRYKINVYSLETNEEVASYSVQGVKPIESFYVVHGTIFAVDSGGGLNIFNDVNNVYNELNGSQVVNITEDGSGLLIETTEGYYLIE